MPRFVIDEESLSSLLSGKVVTLSGGWEMILADIGWDRLHMVLMDARRDSPIFRRGYRDERSQRS